MMDGLEDILPPAGEPAEPDAAAAARALLGSQAEPGAAPPAVPGKRHYKKRKKATKADLKKQAREAGAERDRLRAQLEAEKPAAGAGEEAPPAGGLSPEQMAALIPKALSGAFRSVFRLIARRRGEHWALSDQEAQELGESWDAALAPFAGALDPRFVGIFAAVFVTAEVVEQRLSLDGKTPVPAKQEPAAPVELSDGVTLHTRGPDAG